jgi:hypothetical protein
VVSGLPRHWNWTKLTSDPTSERLSELAVKQAQGRRNAGPTPHDCTYTIVRVAAPRQSVSFVLFKESNVFDQYRRSRPCHVARGAMLGIIRSGHVLRNRSCR